MEETRAPSPCTTLPTRISSWKPVEEEPRQQWNGCPVAPVPEPHRRVLVVHHGFERSGARQRLADGQHHKDVEPHIDSAKDLLLNSNSNHIEVKAVVGLFVWSSIVCFGWNTQLQLQPERSGSPAGTRSSPRRGGGASPARACPRPRALRGGPCASPVAISGAAVAALRQRVCVCSLASPQVAAQCTP